METFLEVLKWVGIVLAAGFIGYFGRYVAMRLISSWEKGKAEEQKGPTPAVEPENLAGYKTEKKKAKQAVKAAKKASKN